MLYDTRSTNVFNTAWSFKDITMQLCNMQIALRFVFRIELNPFESVYRKGVLFHFFYFGRASVSVFHFLNQFFTGTFSPFLFESLDVCALCINALFHLFIVQYLWMNLAFSFSVTFDVWPLDPHEIYNLIKMDVAKFEQCLDLALYNSYPMRN